MAEGVGLSLAVLGICPLRSQANCVLIPLPIPWHAARASNGGGSGIRTHGEIAPTPDFESGALNRAQPSLRICLLVDGECGEVFPRSKQADN